MKCIALWDRDVVERWRIFIVCSGFYLQHYWKKITRHLYEVKSYLYISNISVGKTLPKQHQIFWDILSGFPVTNIKPSISFQLCWILVWRITGKTGFCIHSDSRQHTHPFSPLFMLAVNHTLLIVTGGHMHYVVLAFSVWKKQRHAISSCCSFISSAAIKSKKWYWRAHLSS